MKTKLQPPLIISLLMSLAVAPITSAQNVWIGVGGTSATTNWSDTANWSLGASPAGTDVLFGDLGAAAAAGTINSVVDTSGLDTSSLTFTNQSQLGLYHTILIPAGVTLNNAVGFTVGVNNSLNGYLTVVNFTGGGTLVQNGSDLTVKSIGSSSSSGARATLDLSGLSSFVYNGSAGTMTVAGHGSDARGGGTLILAGVSNNLTAGTVDVNTGTGNGGANGLMSLGAGTNIINVGTFNIAGGKVSSATVNFNGSTGGLRLRGLGGTDSDRAIFLLANRHNTGSGTPTGVLDLTGGHPVDILADSITLGQATSSNPSSTQGNTARFLFDAGKVDAVTINMAVNSDANVTTTGTLSVGGGTLLAGSISLVNQTGGSGTGNLIITNGGTVICTNDLVKTTATGTGNITIQAGTLQVLGSIGNGGAPIDSLSLSDATLDLAAQVAAGANVTTLSCGGTTNKINITSIPAVAAYPAQFELIKYSGTLGGSFNIGVGTLPASSPAYAGYISNNAANSSIDIVLTAGKLPARAIAWRGNVSADWDTTTPNWFFSGSSVTYNEQDFVVFDDTVGAGPTSVNLTGTRTPTSVTVSNATKAYSFTGLGNLSGGTGITKDGAAKLTIANSGFNDNTGPLIINQGTVQVGDGASSGTLGSGEVLNGGSLIFARDFLTVANPISGTGELVQNSSGLLTLSGANSYDGATTVSQGTLQIGNAAALGSTNGGTVIASGATLDFNHINIGLEPVTVSGSGVGGLGALVNNGADIFPAVAFVTLAGDTTFGGSGRWDLRSAATGDPSQSYLLTDGQPYKLTKVGANQISIVGTTIDPKLGDIEVQAGILGLEQAITGLGNARSNLIVWPGAQVKFYNITNAMNKQFLLGGDGITASLRNDSGINTVIGPITLSNACAVVVDPGTTLILNGPLSGAGLLNKNDLGTLVLGGVATHAGTVVSAGKLLLGGSHAGGLTNLPGAVFAGTGTNTGVLDVSGYLQPGDTNVAGTITVGNLVLEPGAEVDVDLTSTTTVGGGTNDLVQVNGDLTLNGNTVAVNPQGLLAGHTYTIIQYTGNLINNGGLYAVGPNGYLFTVDTSTAGQIKLSVTGGPPVWNGGSAVSSLWNDAANWGGTAISAGNSLFFAGTARLNNTNDTVAGSPYPDLVFAQDAGAFTLNGNFIALDNSLVNNSANTQTVLLDLVLNGSRTFAGPNAPLIIGGAVTNNANLSILTLSGSGILSNRLVNADGLTNTLALTDTNANWTLMDNPSSLAVTNPIQLNVQAGTFNFGDGASAPILTTTTTTGSGLNAVVGAIANAPAVLNMVNGQLTISSRLNLGGAANTISTLNQSGGTINVMDVLQAADNNASDVAYVNVSGGQLNVDTHTLFLCSRGAGTLTVSGTGLVSCGTLDLSRNASSAGSTGVTHLDGGTLQAQRVTCGTSSTGSAGTPTATFYFNGGTLQARQSRADFFIGRPATPAIPITSIVQSGGAVIDSAGFDVAIGEPLQHDSGLGSTLDGGLTKNGLGTLTLTAANTYTGPTVVSNGVLAITGSVVGDATVAGGGTLTGTGAIGGNLTTLAGGLINPGAFHAIGTLALSGNAVLGGELQLELNPTNAQTSDRLTVGGTATYGGTLTVTNIGPALQVGDKFQLFSAPVSGFTAINLATTDATGKTYTWNNNIGVDGSITVASTVNTTPTNIAVSVTANQITLSWPADQTGWRLQAQTNAPNTGLRTGWVDITGATSTNRVIITPDPANGSVFYRLVYP